MRLDIYIYTFLRWVYVSRIRCPIFIIMFIFQWSIFPKVILFATSSLFFNVGEFFSTIYRNWSPVNAPWLIARLVSLRIYQFLFFHTNIFKPVLVPINVCWYESCEFVHIDTFMSLAIFNSRVEAEKLSHGSMTSNTVTSQWCRDVEPVARFRYLIFCSFRDDLLKECPLCSFGIEKKLAS